MRTHPSTGAAILPGSRVPFIRMGARIAVSHHERWDGSGYPEGLAGDAIPVSARLMAVADVYDALISRRVYKSGMTHEQAVGIILEGRGAHFDPDMVDAFMQVAGDFHEIAKRYADTDEDIERKADTLSLYQQ